MQTKAWWVNMKERDYLGDVGIDEIIILKCILNGIIRILTTIT
jgi:hypothetical protein